jgi:hypothetical protein
MTTAMTTQQNGHANRLEEVLVMGNLQVLTPPERVDYYQRVCGSLGLNPMTKPFEYLTLNGKLVLYATRACSEQLRQIHGVSISEPRVEYMDDLVIVSVTATDKTGRQDSDMGIVSILNLKGENKANALLKAVTKAKRRVTLSICGLGMLDETEVADIPDANKRPPVAMPTARIVPEPEGEMAQLAWAQEQADEQTGELPSRQALADILKANDMTVSDLTGVFGAKPTREDYWDHAERWLSENPGKDLVAMVTQAKRMLLLDQPLPPFE